MALGKYDEHCSLSTDNSPNSRVKFQPGDIGNMKKKAKKLRHINNFYNCYINDGSADKQTACDVSSVSAG